VIQWLLQVNWSFSFRVSRWKACLFNFPLELFREFTITRVYSPEIPVRNFTDTDLHSRNLLLRHVSLKTEATQRYLVSDGKHTIQSEVHFVAEPQLFVRLHRSIGPTTRLGSPTDGLIPVKPMHLWAETNLDANPDAIRFSVVGEEETPFRLLNSEGRIQRITTFTQSVSLPLLIFNTLMFSQSPNVVYSLYLLWNRKLFVCDYQLCI
jgi:hypothetical protein